VRLSRREIAVNTLLGIFLVSVFLLPLLLALFVAGYVLQVVDRWMKPLLPGTVHSELVLFYFLLCGLSFFLGVAHMRRKNRRNAFLSFAFLPMIASMWFAHPHSVLGLNSAFWQWPFFLLISIQMDSLLTWLEFLVGAATVAAAVAINTGLLGAGPLFHVASECVIAGVAGIFVWSMVRFSRQVRKPEPEPPSLSTAVR
jgi:hypothetical protein